MVTLYLGCSPEDSVPIFYLQICYAVKILIPFRKGVLRYGLSTGGGNRLSSGIKRHFIRNGPCIQANQRPADLCGGLSQLQCDSDESHQEFQQHRFVLLLLLQEQLAAAKSFCLEDSV